MAEEKHVVCENCRKYLESIRLSGYVPKEDMVVFENPRNFVNVNYPVRLDDGRVIMVSGFRVQYNDALGPYKGGVRFHESVMGPEVAELAFLMTLKNSLVGLPFGGAKGGVKINAKNFSAGELERIARGYVSEMFCVLGPKKDIPAPDVNTNPRVMGWMMDSYEQIAKEKAPSSFTGKPIILGGSQVRDVSTAMGAFYILEEKYEEAKKEDVTVAVQGFGNAGRNLSLMLSEIGFKVVAVSDSVTALYNPDGLSIKELMRLKDSGSTFADSLEKHISNEELLELDVDLLVPAALGDVINSNNVGGVKANVVVELANAPLSKEADEALYERGVEVIPDILANAGGVIVSYFEWVQGLQGSHWSREEILSRLKKRILDSYKNVMSFSKEEGVSFRTAAYVIAVKRVVDAERFRGRI